MSGKNHTTLAVRLLVASLPIALIGASASAGTEAPASADPMRFFEGRTEGISTVKVIAKRPYNSRTIGRGEIGADGMLKLVQRVHEEGKPVFDRRWRMKQVGPGRFTGSMSEASGPVIVEEIGESFRFRFKMKGNLSIEQWLTPLPGGKSARSKISIRKFGMTVGHSEGTIRKL